MLARPIWLHIFALGVYAFMYIPILVLVLFSFEKSRMASGITGFTFDWYTKLFHNGDIGSAFLNSLIVAVIAVIVSSVMGTMAAVGLTRLHFKGKGLYRGLLLLPIIIPEIAMAVSALILFI
ncbi:MAG: spermidine/putrescine ABC transporter permease PotC, partial [Leptolyngbya sp.]|nr:spermidine/putrescine ABC transporter permease PotC [Candidatus Melainabacteria bacterium]